MNFTKIAITVIFFTGCVCFCNGQQLADREQESLSAEVSGITRYIYDFGFKDSLVPVDPIHTLNWEQINGFEYNKQGNMILNVSYNFDPKRFTIYDYDTKQRVIVEDMFIGDTNNLYRGIRFFYNQDEKLAYAKYKWKTDGKVQYSYHVKLYKNGLLVKDCQVSDDSTLIECKEVTEVITGNKRTITMLSDGKPLWIETTDVKNGLLYARINYKTNGSLRDSEEHTYNEKGQLIKTVMGSGLFGSITYWYVVFEYNPDGTLSKKTRFEENKIYEIENFTYDEHKNVIAEAKTHAKDNYTSTQIFTYTYDKYGNWILRLKSQKTPWNSLLPNRIEYRKLTYFE